MKSGGIPPRGLGKWSQSLLGHVLENDADLPLALEDAVWIAQGLTLRQGG